MLTVLWSTPRTGSSWYSLFLLDEVKKTFPHAYLLKQYLGKYQMTTYNKTNHSDILGPPYMDGYYYKDYFLQPLSNKILSKTIVNERVRNLQDEEAYRISLLEKTNLQKWPVVISQHVKPMSTDAYYYLKNKADRNIFIWRENIVDQLASYVVAQVTKQFRKTNELSPEKIVENASIDPQRIDQLYERIEHWHELDKTGCEIIKYEDIDFSKGNFLHKQHSIKPIEQCSKKTQDQIYNLNQRFRNFMVLNQISKKFITT